MNNWFNKETFSCIVCRHSWVLISDTMITTEQHFDWLKKALEEHLKIHINEKEKDNG